MRILISNINRLTTASQVANLFVPFGLVLASKIVRNSDNRSSNCFALIEINEPAGAAAIRKLHNFRFMDRYIGVEEFEA